LFEDCCSRPDLILKFNSSRGKYKDFSDIEQLVIALAKSKKTQESVYASWLLEADQKILRENIAKFGMAEFTFMGLRENWASLEFDSYTRFEYIPPMLVDICSGAKAFTREGFNKTAPYIATLFEGRDTVKDDVNLDKHLLIDDFLPSSALDKHTRVGGFATRLFASKYELPFDKANLDRVLFLNEGMYCKDRLIDIGFMQTWYETMDSGKAWAACKSKLHEDWFASAYKDLNSLRVWALGTIKDDYEYMKKLAKQISVEFV
jgi:hypothetical protein